MARSGRPAGGTLAFISALLVVLALSTTWYIYFAVGRRKIPASRATATFLSLRDTRAQVLGWNTDGTPRFGTPQ